MKRVLVACEESQTVCKAFRARGFEAYSCDIQECSGGKPEWHIKGDAIEAMRSRDWDIVIAHPPCTHLAVSGARHFEQKRADGRQQEAVKFFMEFVHYAQNHPSCHVAIENPVCIMSSVYRKPDQYIQPWQFGHPETKKTGLWLFNLPPLSATDDVYYQMLRLPDCVAHRIHYMGGGHSKERSKTYTGIAMAMAQQWGDYVIKNG